VDDRTGIRRVVCKGVWPTAPRDFLICTTWTELDDGSIIIATRGASDALYPPQKGFVRGFVQISGFWIQPVETLRDDPEAQSKYAGGCKLTLTAHTELGGSLPASVINLLSTSAPLKLLASVEEILMSQPARPRDEEVSSRRPSSPPAGVVVSASASASGNVSKEAPQSEHAALVSSAKKMFVTYIGAQHLLRSSSQAAAGGGGGGVDAASVLPPAVDLNWQQRVSKNGINVMTSPVAGSVWQVIRGTIYVRAHKSAVCELLTDDDRMGDYDENVDFVQVLLEWRRFAMFLFQFLF